MLSRVLQLRSVYLFGGRRMQTQIFETLTDKELATPQYVRKVLLKRVHMAQPTAMMSLYHNKQVRHAIKSCFSEKKTKRYKRVNTSKRYYNSELLKKKIRIRVSKKAQRCIVKMGSFDNYILCTKPKDLNSKMGEYYRTLMLRKINDPEYRIPYILRTKTNKLVKHYDFHMQNEKMRRLTIPRHFYKTFETYQRKFGTRVEELNEEDYKKFLELQKLHRASQTEISAQHPLLAELSAKLIRQETPEENEMLDQQADKALEGYLSRKKFHHQRIRQYEKDTRELELMELKLKETFFKHMSQTRFSQIKQQAEKYK